ncbi:hypothetical protein Goshw_023622 [Gossypium schwendimanii]|uniref:Uncharacterized protein n=3 Tax=Gossypium TaxID=3633 RepID=A0A7J9MDV1_GOSSC|nr:hypothetical protein [Gossypium davidsonii]MBA0869138.1 hypothetical protein [Gossypium schwendimanii]
MAQTFFDYLFQVPISGILSGSPNSTSLTPLLFRSLLRLLMSLLTEPAASVTTLLYYSDNLPQNIIWERLTMITTTPLLLKQKGKISSASSPFHG